MLRGTMWHTLEHDVPVRSLPSHDPHTSSYPLSVIFGFLGQ
jgi:hypothetical protein